MFRRSGLDVQRVVPELRRQREQDEQQDRQCGNPVIEQRARQAVQRKDRGDRGQRRDGLRRDPPGVGAMPREPGDRRFRDPDEGGIERVLVALADHVERGPGLELAGDPDELQPVLRREDRARDSEGMLA